jgi:hypothetical protein
MFLHIFKTNSLLLAIGVLFFFVYFSDSLRAS